MARSINEDDGKVANLADHRGKGRGKSRPAPVPQDGGEEEERAPGLGHNQPTEGEFLRWVQRLRAQDNEVEIKALALKDERGKRKDLRKEAQASGLVMGELDDAIAELNTDQVDLVAKEERRRLYRMWLGLPVGAQTTLKLPKTDAEAERQRWAKRGEIAGRLGQPRVNPEGCPPERLQDYFKGWEAAQAALMRGADLTRAAFEKKIAPVKAAAEAAPKGLAGDGGLTGGVKAKGKGGAVNKTSSDPEPPAQQILVLNEADFAPGTPLDDANLRTLIDAKREAFDAADRVVALFGAQRRIIKEPDPAMPGGVYVDDGVEAPVSDPEPVDQDVPTAAELT